MVNPRDIKIVNVVVSSAIGTEIKDLRELARALDRAEYNPQQFPGLVYRTRRSENGRHSSFDPEKSGTRARRE